MYPQRSSSPSTFLSGFLEGVATSIPVASLLSVAQPFRAALQKKLPSVRKFSAQRQNRPAHGQFGLRFADAQGLCMLLPGCKEKAGGAREKEQEWKDRTFVRRFVAKT